VGVVCLVRISWNSFLHGVSIFSLNYCFEISLSLHYESFVIFNKVQFFHGFCLLIYYSCASVYLLSWSNLSNHYMYIFSFELLLDHVIMIKHIKSSEFELLCFEVQAYGTIQRTVYGELQHIHKLSPYTLIDILCVSCFSKLFWMWLQSGCVF
jgi:hypothetical protein